MTDENKLVAPTLPNGMFFRVKRDSYGDVIVEIRKKYRLIFSKRVGFIDTQSKHPSTASVLEAMALLKDRYALSTLSYFGDYPPKTVIE